MGDGQKLTINFQFIRVEKRWVLTSVNISSTIRPYSVTAVYIGYYYFCRHFTPDERIRQIVF